MLLNLTYDCRIVGRKCLQSVVTTLNELLTHCSTSLVNHLIGGNLHGLNLYFLLVTSSSKADVDTIVFSVHTADSSPDTRRSTVHDEQMKFVGDERLVTGKLEKQE